MQTQKNSLATISQPPTSKQPVSSSEAIRQFLVKVGEVYGRQITAPLVAIWTEELQGYPVTTLEPILRNVIRTCKFFPTPADVLEPLNRAVKRDNSDAAEKAWQYTLDYCREWVHPDIHFSRAPELPKEIVHAARAAGGVYYLRSCPHEELSWRKKSFVEAFLRRRDTVEHENLLTGGELTKLLHNLGKELPDGRP